MGVGVKVKFNANNARRVVGHIEGELAKRLRKCAEMLRTKVVHDISTPTRAAGPSAPHTPPHADTGFLRKSVSWDVDSANLVARVGTPVMYGAYLEQGTQHMEAREFLEPAAKEMRAQLIKVLTAKIK